MSPPRGFRGGSGGRYHRTHACVQIIYLRTNQALGELVQFGVVIALGLSGHAHGLRHARLPIVAAFVPGLPVSFAVVFYFLLETRALAEGSQRGTLLPLHSGGQEPRIDHTL